ncbi:PREDICTED: uncharacterized protein LOC104567725, partial [Tinamus guttatus]|uniref:uncharacterized protein LOC104567725 n=1 Tax=Tinamus guttatus TaxID=94827 RepID=UPI00052F1129
MAVVSHYILNSKPSHWTVNEAGSTKNYRAPSRPKQVNGLHKVPARRAPKARKTQVRNCEKQPRDSKFFCKEKLLAGAPGELPRFPALLPHSWRPGSARGMAPRDIWTFNIILTSLLLYNDKYMTLYSHFSLHIFSVVENKQVLCFHKVLSQQYASEFLARKRRANSFMEESKKGNLERECIEELCNKEEAREIFENNPETEYFYPKYLSCLASHRAGVFRVTASTPDSPADLRACVNEISNQCSPLPCNRDGYKDCIDGQAKYTCVCKPGWQGEKCEE